MRNFGTCQPHCQLHCEKHDDPEPRLLRNTGTVGRALFEEARRALRSAMDSAPPSLPLRPPAPASPRAAPDSEFNGDLDAEIARLDACTAASAQAAARLRGLRATALAAPRQAASPPSALPRSPTALPGPGAAGDTYQYNHTTLLQTVGTCHGGTVNFAAPTASPTTTGGTRAAEAAPTLGAYGVHAQPPPPNKGGGLRLRACTDVWHASPAPKLGCDATAVNVTGCDVTAANVVQGQDITDVPRPLEGKVATLTLNATACPTGPLPASRANAIRNWAKGGWAAAQLARSSWAGPMLANAEKEAPPLAHKGSPAYARGGVGAPSHEPGVV